MVGDWAVLPRREASSVYGPRSRFRLTERPLFPQSDRLGRECAHEGLPICVKRRHTAFQSQKAGARGKTVCGRIRAVLGADRRLPSRRLSARLWLLVESIYRVEHAGELVTPAGLLAGLGRPPGGQVRSVPRWLRAPADRESRRTRAIEMRTYIEQEAMRALTPTGGFLRGFAYSLNPYTGCAFGAGGGCPFCYVRALPVAHAHAGRWGAWVIAKTNLPELLERELA
jgi:hypothetical protein